MVSACSSSEKRKKEDVKGTIAVTDFRGKELHLKKPADHIVCLIESALSGIYMLGAENKIVGISTSVYDDNVSTQYACLDERIKNKSINAPGNWDFVNIESVIALKPDLVIMWASQEESIESMESKGIPVYAVMLKSTNDVYKEISDLGKLTGKEKRADSLVQYTKDELSKIDSTNKTLIKGKKSVYFMWSQGQLETSGKNSTVNELIMMAGAKNVCTSTDEHLIANLEKVIEWNPDIIVMWYNANKNPDDILQLAEWSNIRAIKEKQVFELPSVFFCDLWTLKFQYAVKLLSTWCYPDEFKEYDLEKEKRQMLLKLYGSKGGKIK
jgi:iron complex transport system substrate-binding protein